MKEWRGVVLYPGECCPNLFTLMAWSQLRSATVAGSVARLMRMGLIAGRRVALENGETHTVYRIVRGDCPQDDGRACELDGVA